MMFECGRVSECVCEYIFLWEVLCLCVHVCSMHSCVCVFIFVFVYIFFFLCRSLNNGDKIDLHEGVSIGVLTEV